MSLKRVFTGREPKVVRVLELDPALGAGPGDEGLETARTRAVGELVDVPSGRSRLPDPPGEGGLGLLVVEGLPERDVVLAGVGCAELIGPGGLTWPWEDEEGMPSVPAEMTWTARAPRPARAGASPVGHGFAGRAREARARGAPRRRRLGR